MEEYHSVCFFFSSRRRHTRYWRDWSSDVCSSDLCALSGVRSGVSTLNEPYHRVGREQLPYRFGEEVPHEERLCRGGGPLPGGSNKLSVLLGYQRPRRARGRDAWPWGGGTPSQSSDGPPLVPAL